METTTRHRFTAALSAAVSAAGLAVMAGWFFDVPALKSVSPDFVSMKFTTALCFFLSGALIFLLAESVRGHVEAAQVLMPPLALGVLLVMTTLAASTALDMESGVEELFVHGSAPAWTPVPGRPSVVTMIDFILIAACGIAALFDTPRLWLWLLSSGGFLIASGSLALAGYAAGVPLLYYYVSGYLTAMALHTAVLFVMAGAALVIVSREARERAAR